MRKVYLTREKTFAACLATLSVYIEDGINPDFEISGVPCRHICKIKNGETVSFDIGNEAKKVFVIADTVSRNYSNDYYQIPAGENDVEISGKNVVNPGIGNPFRFNGVTDEDALAGRKSANRKGVLITILAVLLGAVIGFVSTMDTWLEKPKTFVADSFEIVLTTAFSDDYEDGVYYFGSKDCSVAVYEYSYSEHADIIAMDEQQFLELHQASGHFLAESKIVSESGLKFIEEEAESNAGDIRSYFTVFVKGEESFFLFEFGCKTNEYEEYRPSFVEWASSIKIK